MPVDVDGAAERDAGAGRHQRDGVGRLANVTLNTTDASLGNAISREQIRSLPIEAQNVVQLLSLQPGAVFIPDAVAGRRRGDPRYGAVAGARADQQSVTLDGIDVNDPQNQTAYTSAVRMTQEALQEFRVSTANYNADSGRSSGPQVSLVTRSGTNQFDGSGYWTFRRTATSSNEYFLKLSQLGPASRARRRSWTRTSSAESIGGPIRTQPAVLLRQPREPARAERDAPHAGGAVELVPRRRPDVPVRVAAACPGGSVRGFNGTHAVPVGWYGMTPAEIAALDPLRIGPSRGGVRSTSGSIPSPNDPGRDTNNIDAFRFAAPIENEFYTLISRVDYNLSESGNHKLFGRFGKQDDTINDPPQFPGQDAAAAAAVNNYGLALGYDSVLSAERSTNSFRYGVTQIDEANQGVTNSNYVTFRFIDPFDAVRVWSDGPSPMRASRTRTTSSTTSPWFKSTHNLKLGTNLRFTRVPKERFQSSFLSAICEPVLGGRRRPPQHARQRLLHRAASARHCPLCASAGQAGYADSLAQHPRRVVTVHAARQLRPTTAIRRRSGTPVARTLASDEYEVYLQDSWQLRPNLTLTGGLRYSLYSPPYEVNGLQVAPRSAWASGSTSACATWQQGIPSNRSPIVTFDLAGPDEQSPGLLRVGQEQLRAARRRGVEPDRRARIPAVG